MDKTLTNREKKVLEGVHARHYRTGGILAKNPSKLDYEILNYVYGALIKQEEDKGLCTCLNTFI